MCGSHDFIRQARSAYGHQQTLAVQPSGRAAFIATPIPGVISYKAIRG